MAFLPKKDRELVDAVIYLNDGREIKTRVTRSIVLSTDSFKGETIWRFISRDDKKNYFITGDRISFIEIESI